MRLAADADIPAIEAFLFANATVAMFPLTNLLDHGLGTHHQKAMTFWINDPLTDVLGLSGEGMLMPVFTFAEVSGIAAALSGQVVVGVVGTEVACAAVKAAFDLPKAALDRVEPRYEMDVTTLVPQNVDGLEVVPFTRVPRDVLIAWRTDYYIEALDVRPADAPARAIAHVNAALESGVYRVLTKDETPLAVTGFNSVLPKTVMIGGVYTPQALRGHGYAGKALALHLAEARTKGVEQAVLSAANEAAAKAYERIGFQKMGTFNITLFDDPVTLHG